MGKLNIAHHKSYHPYRQDNIARVRRDEEEARRKGVEEEDRALLADSESRLDALRQRVESTGEENTHRDDDEAAAGPSRPPTLANEEVPISSSLSNSSSRHINLFEDLEQQSAVLAARASKKGPVVTAEDRGFALAPTKKDLNPWYSSKGSREADRDVADDEDCRERKKGDDRRRRDQARKSAHDPLASIPRHLLNSTSHPSSSSSSSRPSKYPPRLSTASTSSHDRTMPPPPAPPPAHTVEARLTRESSERARAQELLRRKQKEREREMMSNSSVTGTPSTVHGGTSDMYNREEVEEARRHKFGGREGHGERRDGWKEKGWDDDMRDGRRDVKAAGGRSVDGGGRRSWDRR